MLTFNAALWQKFRLAWLRWIPIPTWPQLNAVRVTNAVKALWVWTVLVPMIARFTSQLPDSIKVPMLNVEIQIPLHLPFSLAALYFSGVAFAIGGTLFILRCPKIIRSYPTERSVVAADDCSAAEASAYVVDLFASNEFAISNTHYLVLADVIESIWSHYEGERGLYSLDPILIQHPTSGVERLQLLLGDAGDRRDILLRMFYFAAVSRFWARTCCAFTYAVGGCFLLVVMFQSFMYVVRELSW